MKNNKKLHLSYKIKMRLDVKTMKSNIQTSKPVIMQTCFNPTQVGIFGATYKNTNTFTHQKTLLHTLFGCFLNH